MAIRAIARISSLSLAIIVQAQKTIPGLLNGLAKFFVSYEFNTRVLLRNEVIPN